MEWSVSLIPPEFSTIPEGAPPSASPPEAAWRAHTDDQRPIECVVWGRGTPNAPMSLFVRVGALIGTKGGRVPPGEQREEATLAPPRMPTFQEMCAAIDHAALEGSVFSLGVYASSGRGSEPDPLPDGTKWVGMAVSQVGFAEGSPAGRGSLILTPGGSRDAN